MSQVAAVQHTSVMDCGSITLRYASPLSAVAVTAVCALERIA